MLIPSYDPPAGGAARQLGGLLQWIDRDRFAPFVLARVDHDGRCADLSGTTPVIRILAPLRPSTFFFSALSYLWKRRKEYDVIHVHSFDSPALAGALIRHLMPGKTLILRVPRCGEGSAYDRLTRTRGGRARLRFVLAKADAVIPSCPEATKALDAAGFSPDKIERIPNGVDGQYFFPANEDEKRVLKRSFGISEHAFVAIAVARLVPRNNVASALEAWKRVCASHPASVLIVVGNGPEGPRLSAYADAELDGRSVIFTGGTSRDEVARLFRTADVYVSYSRSEVVSDAMLEAMSSGLPVVAARRPGTDQLVRHSKNGFVFDPDHPMDGADYLLRLAEDPALLTSMSITARDDVESRHSFEQIARLVEQLYSDGPRGAGDDHSYNAATPPEVHPHRSSESSDPQPHQHRKSRRSKRRRRKNRIKL